MDKVNYRLHVYESLEGWRINATFRSFPEELRGKQTKGESKDKVKKAQSVSCLEMTDGYIYLPGTHDKPLPETRNSEHTYSNKREAIKDMQRMDEAIKNWWVMAKPKLKKKKTL